LNECKTLKILEKIEEELADVISVKQGILKTAEIFQYYFLKLNHT
jgi:hypothetical protein